MVTALIRFVSQAFVIGSIGLLVGLTSAIADDDVFLKQTTDRSSVYVGEQLVNTFELYTRVPLVNPQFIDLAYDGFWQVSFSEDQHGAAEVRGRYYNVIKIRRALFALTPGEKELPQRQIKASTIELQQPPPIDDFDPFDRQFMQRFFGEEIYRERIFKSNTLKLAVKPLPAPGSNLPLWPGSLGLVGSTSLRIKSSAAPIRVGESKVITLEVSSIGDLSKLQAPSIANQANYRVYIERPRSHNQESNGRLVSIRSFKITIVPLVAGEIRIAPLRLAYFDPDSKDYHIIESQISAFTALSNPTVASIATPQAREVIATSNTTPLPAATPPVNATPAHIEDEPHPRLLSSSAITLLVAAALVCTMTIWIIQIKFRKRRSNKDKGTALARCANTAELFQAFRNAIVSQLDLSAEITSADALRFAITKAHLDAQVEHKLLSALDNISLAMNQSSLSRETDLPGLKADSQLALSALSLSRA